LEKSFPSPGWQGAQCATLGELTCRRSAEASKPAGNGFLCLGSPFVRLPALNTTSTGDAGYLLNFGSLPAAGPILPGDTRHFVLWYRDPAAGGANFNFSNGLSVQFCP
jgi:hypothetical protein